MILPIFSRSWYYPGNFPLSPAPDQARADLGFSTKPFKAKISNAEQLRAHTTLIIGAKRHSSWQRLDPTSTRQILRRNLLEE